MTRTPDEIRKPLPGQMAFRFLHAEPAPDERPAPGQGQPRGSPSETAGRPVERAAGATQAGGNPWRGQGLA